jgi:uncharacterized membrane protein required for colicin V production
LSVCSFFTCIANSVAFQNGRILHLFHSHLREICQFISINLKFFCSSKFLPFLGADWAWLVDGWQSGKAEFGGLFLVLLIVAADVLHLFGFLAGSLRDFEGCLKVGC